MSQFGKNMDPHVISFCYKAVDNRLQYCIYRIAYINIISCSVSLI